MPAAAAAAPPAPAPARELWVATRRADGVPYYYNAATRATTFVAPDGADVVTHEELAERAARGEY